MKKTTVEIDDFEFTATYIVHPAEPDVGLGLPFVEVLDLDGIVQWDEDLIERVEQQLESELGL